MATWLRSHLSVAYHVARFLRLHLLITEPSHSTLSLGCGGRLTLLQRVAWKTWERQSVPIGAPVADSVSRDSPVRSRVSAALRRRQRTSGACAPRAPCWPRTSQRAIA